MPPEKESLPLPGSRRVNAVFRGVSGSPGL